MFLTMFAMGLIMIAYVATNYGANGITPNEAFTLLGMGILVLTGMVLAYGITRTEIHTRARTEPPFDAEPAPERDEAVVRHQAMDKLDQALAKRAQGRTARPEPAEPTHTLKRTWQSTDSPKPHTTAGLLGDTPPPAFEDAPGTSEKIMRARERGERT